MSGPTPRYTDERTVIRLYAAGASISRIAREQGTYFVRVQTILQRAGVELRPPQSSRPPRKYPKLDDAEWLRVRLIVVGYSTIARELGCRPETVRKAVVAHGIPPGALGRRIVAEVDAQIVANYARLGSMRAVAREVGVSDRRVKRALERAGG